MFNLNSILVFILSSLRQPDISFSKIVYEEMASDFPHLNLQTTPPNFASSFLSTSHYSIDLPFAINVMEQLPNNSQFTLHLILGHLNPNTMKLVLLVCNILFSRKNASTFFFASCMSKAHRLHSPSLHTHYTSQLEPYGSFSHLLVLTNGLCNS